MDKDFYILPSSIHEVLLLPADYKDSEKTEEMRDMVCEVNDTQLKLEERLSYNVYYYERSINQITIL